MNAFLISLLVFAIVFGGAMLGAVLRPLLSEKHLQPDSKDIVKMATGLIGTLAALVLGLLIASAKGSFDLKTNQVRQLTATIILLDDLLVQYGPEATALRTRLRQSIEPIADRIWREQEIPTSRPAHFESNAQALTFENELERLTPKNDAQRSLQARRADPAAVVCPGRPVDPDSVFDYPGVLAERDFREFHLVRANQSGRDGFAVFMRAVICWRDFSGFGAG